MSFSLHTHPHTIVTHRPTHPPATLPGIYDATGPIADVLMMGMANPKQINAGLHQRLFSRAFVAADSAAGGKRFAFVSLDAGMGGIVMKNRVVKELGVRLPGMCVLCSPL